MGSAGLGCDLQFDSMERRPVQNREEIAPLHTVASITSFVFMLLGAVNMWAAGQAAGVGTLGLSPSQLNFGDQLILSATGGGPSAPQTITLTNTGNAALSVTTIALSNHLFSETDTCRTSASGTTPSIAPGGTCTISVVFQPLMCGAISGTLTVTSDTASNSPQEVGLSGTGTGPCATLSQTVLTFTSQLVTTSSAPQSVTLTSTGSQPVVISSLTLQGAFTETNTCTAAPIAPGGTCTISVTFTPTQGGPTPGFIEVNDNTGPIGQVITLSATGSDFSMLGSPTSNTVSAGGSATYTITVTPTGGFNQAVSLACSAPPPGVTCSFSPGSVTPNGSSVATATATVSTTASGFALPKGQRLVFPPGGPGLWILGWCLLAALIATVAWTRLPANQRSRKPRLGWRAIVLGAALAGSLTLAGCGSSTTKISTPAGTYQVLVNGSTPAGSTTVSRPALLILIVQ
jgi:hypothetical protein